MATNPEQPFNGSVFIDEVSGMYSYSKLIFPCSQLNEMLSRASLNENTIIHSVTMLDADEYAGEVLLSMYSHYAFLYYTVQPTVLGDC